MGRTYVDCHLCHDTLPEWMGGDWACSCGETEVAVRPTVGCVVCGTATAEHEDKASHYRMAYEGGGGHEAWLHFCGSHPPWFDRVVGRFGPGGGMDADGLAALLVGMGEPGGVPCQCGQPARVAAIMPVSGMPGGTVISEGLAMAARCVDCQSRASANGKGNHE